jgi:beta-lactamase regulating signal transducer with metallopeptidase domain
MTAWLEFGLSNALAATALAAVALAIARFTRRPQVAFVVWLLVLAKLLVPPLVSVPLPTLRPPVEMAPASDGAVRPTAPFALAPDATFDVLRKPALQTPGEPLVGATAEFPRPIYLEPTKPRFALPPAGFVVATWLVVSFCWLALAAIRMARFRRVLSHARRAPPALEQEVRTLAARLGVRRVPRVKLVKRRIPPLVWALFGEPVILLPAGLLRILSPLQRSTLLVHELAHLKRRDHLARLLELAALGLYWWHPVAWWARRNAERAAEQCCDAEVVAHMGGAACAYAEALVTTVDFLSEAPGPLPLGASGFSQAVHVKRRIEMILEANPVRRPVRQPVRPLRLILLALGLAVLPLSLRALWAEPAAPAAESTAAAAEESARSPDEQPKLDAAPKGAQPVVQPAEPENAATEPARAPNATEDPTKVAQDERVGDDWPGLAVTNEWANMMRQAALNVELTKTNAKRLLAALRQLQAVQMAFDRGTVTIDQLLEVQRRLAEAEMSYLRASCDLCSEADQRHYMFAVMAVDYSRQALSRARRTWKQARYELDPDESRAREQYYQFKSQMQTRLNEYLREEARRKSAKGRR